MFGLLCPLLLSMTLSSVESHASRHRRGMELDLKSAPEVALFVVNMEEVEKHVNKSVEYAKAMKNSDEYERLELVADALHTVEEFPAMPDKFSRFIETLGIALRQFKKLDGEGEALCKALNEVAAGFLTMVEYLKTRIGKLDKLETPIKLAADTTTVKGGTCDYKKAIELLQKALAEM